MFRNPFCVIVFNRLERNFLCWGRREEYPPQVARNSREFTRDTFFERPLRFRFFGDYKASTFVPAGRLCHGEQMLLLCHLGVHLLDLGELVVQNQLRFRPIDAQDRKTLVDRVKLSVEVSEAALLVVDDALRFGPILDNRVEQSLARFEEAGATFDLSCLRSRPY